MSKAADYNRDDTVPPAAILWPDEKREWKSSRHDFEQSYRSS